MITLDFQIKPEYLAYYCIKNTSPQRFVAGTVDPEVVDFQNAAWSKDKEAYYFLCYGVSDTLVLSASSMSDLAKRAQDLLQTMVKDPTFVPLLKETSESLGTLRQEWEANCFKTHNMVSEMTGLELKGDFKVFLSHPSLKQGQYINKLKAFCWAYRAPWPNYNTVYFWHELLHSFVPGGDLEHAAIQFVADNELRVRLNGGEYPPFEGHGRLNELMELMLPYWKKYLQLKKKEIDAFIKELAGMPEIQKQLEKTSKD